MTFSCCPLERCGTSKFSSQHSVNEHDILLLRESKYAIWEFVSSVFLEQQTHGRHSHLVHPVDADSWSTLVCGNLCVFDGCRDVCRIRYGTLDRGLLRGITRLRSSRSLSLGISLESRCRLPHAHFAAPFQSKTHQTSDREHGKLLTILSVRVNISVGRGRSGVSTCSYTRSRSSVDREVRPIHLEICVHTSRKRGTAGVWTSGQDQCQRSFCTNSPSTLVIYADSDNDCKLHVSASRKHHNFNDCVVMDDFHVIMQSPDRGVWNMHVSLLAGHD